MTGTYKYRVICVKEIFIGEKMDFLEATKDKIKSIIIYPSIKGEWSIKRVEE